MIVSIFCGSKHKVEPSFFPAVKSLIQQLETIENIKIAYGGGKTGLMKEIFNNCNHNLISVNCEKWRQPEEDGCYIEEYLYTSILDRQNHLLRIADAYIVCPGGVGTVFEFLQALTCNDIKECNKPIFVFNHNNYFSCIFDFIEHARNSGMITKTNEEWNLFIESTPELLVAKIKETCL